MEVGYRGASLVEEFNADQDTYLEIDDVSSSWDYEEPAEVVTNTKDVFAQVKIAALDPKLRRKANTLNKKLENTKGDAGSKYIDEDYINGYDLLDLKAPPYDLDLLALIFEENSTHQAACVAKATNTCGLGWDWVHARKTRGKLEEAADDEEKRAKILRNVQGLMEDMDEMFEDFHAEETFSESLVKAITDMHALGNGYVEIGRNRLGKISYVGHIMANQIRVRRKRDGFVQLTYSRSQNQQAFFRNFQDLKTENPLGNDDNPNELIHFKNYSPRNSYYGVPSAVSALSSIIGDKFAKQYNIDYFENKAIPRYAIIIKGAKLSAKSTKEIIQFFRNEVKGQSHGTLIIPLPASVGNQVELKFEKLEDGVQESSFQKYRQDNRDEIVVAHRIPPSKIGITASSNLANSRDGDKTFKEQVISPDQERVEKRINKLVQEFTDSIRFKLKKVDLIDEDMKSRIHDRYLRTEVMSPNEVRDELGKTARAGGDEVLPFATKVQLEKVEIDGGIYIMTEEEKAAHDEHMKNQMQLKPPTTGTGKPGAPSGNSNNPAKAGPETPKDQTGTRAERGQVQDEAGVRERS